jgi:hypothetical protein
MTISALQQPANRPNAQFGAAPPGMAGEPSTIPNGG